MEPGGRFVLYFLPDGRTIADLKLEAEPSLGAITLLQSGGKYFVLTSHSAADGAVRHGHSPGQRRSLPASSGNGLQPQPDATPSSPVAKCRLYAIDGHGKLVWPAPVKIEEQMIPVNQPADLPILIFAGRVLDMGRKSVLCIDKLNGRSVYQGKVADPGNFMRVVGDAKKKTVDLINGTNMVTLTFTDKPWSPASGTGAAAAK